MQATETSGAIAPWSQLRTLAAVLPLPCGLFTVDGRVIWLSRMAAIAMGLDLDEPAGLHPVPTLVAWRRLARLASRAACAAGPSGLQDPDHAGLRAWLHRESGGIGPIVFVAVCGDGHEIGLLPEEPELRAQGLTPREIDVLQLVVQGYSVLNAAHALGIKETTVTTHLKHLYRKLGVSNRAELAMRVLFRNGSGSRPSSPVRGMSAEQPAL